jgi:hypothetical protein
VSVACSLQRGLHGGGGAAGERGDGCGAASQAEAGRAMDGGEVLADHQCELALARLGEGRRQEVATTGEVGGGASAAERRSSASVWLAVVAHAPGPPSPDVAGQAAQPHAAACAEVGGGGSVGEEKRGGVVRRCGSHVILLLKHNH